MVPQFSLRSLLGFVTFVAVILSVLSVAVVARNPTPDGSLLFYLRCVAVTPLVFGGVVFWLVLLLPTWLPLCVFAAEVRKRERMHPFLALIPAAWYCALVVLFHVVWALDEWPTLHYVLKAVAIVGTVLACWALIASVGRRRFVLIVPLGVAIASGTATILFACP